MLFGIDLNLIGIIIDILGFVATIVIFVITSIDTRKATEDQTRRECVRATLTEFATIRRTHQNFQSRLDSDDRDEVLRSYLSDLERFAVGCNMDAYALDVVNSMSGGMLISQYQKYFRDFILERRRKASLTAKVKPWQMYKEFESMMKKLYQMREMQWEEPIINSEEMAVLDKFLNMPVDSSEEIFAQFRCLDGVIERHGEGKEGYLYVPGSRKDRCVIAAHADTYFDKEYQGKVISSKVSYKDGIYFSESDESSIGADDRAGCAMLWLLRNSGHSLLILDGEEHGQVGAGFLKDSNPELFNEINEHSFILQLDRRGSSDYKYYSLPVTPEFIKYIEKSTGYMPVQDKGKTDICTLCAKACGANLSIGYYDEHKPSERLCCDEWLNTYNIVKNMLMKPLNKYPLKDTSP